MAWVAVAVVGSQVVGSMISADAQSGAADAAAGAQTAASQAGIAEQRRQFDAIQKLLQPYVDAGNKGLTGQLDLSGANGATAQQAAIDALKQSPAFTAAQDLGQRSILANASATGGLRGGNVQAALAQFSPALLAQTINDQYSRLGGLTSIGQNAAAGVGNAGMQTGNSVATLLGQIGSAQAGGALAQGRATAGLANGMTGAIGQFVGMRGMGGGGGTGWGANDGTFGGGVQYGSGLDFSNVFGGF